MYLQVGAVAIVSLLTKSTVACVPPSTRAHPTSHAVCRRDVLSTEAAAVNALKLASSAAAKAYTASPTNSTLAAARTAAAASFTAADAMLTSQKIEVAALLAFWSGIFSFGIGILKIGKVMNLMGPVRAAHDA